MTFILYLLPDPFLLFLCFPSSTGHPARQGGQGAGCPCHPLLFSAHLLSISSSTSPGFIKSHRLPLLSPSRLSDQPLRWLLLPIVPPANPLYHAAASCFSMNLSHSLPYLEPPTASPIVLSEPSLDSLIHSRRPYRIWSLSPFD